jgi:acyl dehydratase
MRSGFVGFTGARESVVVNDWETVEETRADETASVIGATKTLTRALSEADLALFALVMGEAELDGEAHLEAEPRYHREASPALLAALLTSSAALHSDQPASARFTSAQVRFVAPAFADETVRASATVTDVDEPTGSLRVQAICDAEDGRRLAEADFLLQRD